MNCIRTKFSSPIDITKTILRTEGTRGLYRGLTTTFARECPGYGLFFGGYELTRSLLTKSNEKKTDIGKIDEIFSIESKQKLKNIYTYRIVSNMDIRWYGWHLFLDIHVSNRCH